MHVLLVREAWEEIVIIVNANINKLCNQGRYSDAKELENCRDIVALSLAMSGIERVMK